MSSAVEPAARSSAGFPPAAVRASLERVAASPHFARSERLTRFLRFTVEARLHGRAHELKERTIACEVYGRRPDYDPRSDPIVRSEAHRLRARLEAYYAREGSADPIAIEVPKGAYLPEFRPNRATPDAALCRLAVAPFEDESPRRNEAGLARGIGEAVALRLASRPGLRIAYRRSGGRGGDGAPLDADLVLEGSFRRVGERCALSVGLLRVTNREKLWSETFSFAWDGVVAVQSEIAERVAAVAGSFPVRAGGSPPAVSPRAYELFLKARPGVVQFANSRQREFLLPARRRLLRAVELEPGFSDALADLAFLELLQLNPPQAPPALLIERARGFLERALAADRVHVRSLYLLGDAEGNSGRAREGLDLTETAVALDPDDAEARTFLAMRYASFGFYESAVACCDQALRLDPVWDAAYQAKALYHTLAGEPAEAVETLEAHHRRSVPNSVSETVLAGALAAAGEPARAEAAAARAAAKLSPQEDRSHLEIVRGLVAALQRDAATARRAFEAQRRSPPRILDHLIRLAFALGEPATALDLLEASPYHRNYRWLASEPLARPFLRDPAFGKFLAELHTDWLRNLDEVGPRLPVSPPPLPFPAALAG
jgi:serine/threonine-protein kinase